MSDLRNIRYGTITPDKIMFGAHEIQKVYFGDHAIWDLTGSNTNYPDWAHYREITIPNNGNPDALNDDQIAIEFTSLNFDFSKPNSDGSDIRFEDLDGNILKFWIKRWISSASLGTIYVRLSGHAAESFKIHMAYGKASATSESDFSIMKRISVESEMDHLYPFDTDLNDDVGAVNFTGTNTVISDSGCGNGLRFNGSTSYATASLFDSWAGPGGFGLIFIPFATHENGSTLKRIAGKINLNGTDSFSIILNTNGTLTVRFTNAGTSKDFISVRAQWLANVPYSIQVNWTAKYGYIHIVNETFYFPSTYLPNNGNYSSFYLGATSIPSLYFNGWICDFHVFDENFPYKKLRAIGEMTKVVPKDMISKLNWISDYQYPGSINGEPSPVWDSINNKLLLYTNQGDPPDQERYIVRVESSDEGVTFTNWHPVVGNGYGGWSGHASRTFAQGENGVMYLDFWDGINKPLSQVHASDGLTFSGKSAILSLAPYVDNGTVHNSGRIKIGATYYMLVDGRNTTNPIFQEGLAFASAIDGTYSWAENNPQDSLRWGANGGTYGACDLHLINGSLYCMFLAVPPGFTTLPSFIRWCKCVDITNNSWVPVYDHPILLLDRPRAVDQVGNTRMIEGNGKCYIVACYANNESAPNFVLFDSIYRFDGTKEQLVTDLITSVGSQVTANPLLDSITVYDTDATKIIIAYDGSLDENTGTSAVFTPIGGKSVTDVTISDTNIIVTVDSKYLDSDSITIEMNNSGVDPIKDITGSILSSFTARIVTNNITNPSLSTATVENANPNKIILTYNQNLTTSPLPATTDFSASGGKVVSNVAIAGAIVTLTVDSNYAHGDTITILYIPGTNKIADIYGNVALGLTNHAVTNNIAAFDPSTLSPQYFDHTVRTFTGSNYIDTGIKNAAFTNTYWHVFLKVKPTDGQPAATQNYFGAKTSVAATRTDIINQTDGTLNCNMAAITRISATAFWTNGQQVHKVIRLSRDASNYYLYLDGVLKDTFTDETNPTNQTTRNMYYGAFNSDGSTANYFIGEGKGLFIWGGSVDLTAQNLSDLETYFDNL